MGRPWNYHHGFSALQISAVCVGSLLGSLTRGTTLAQLLPDQSLGQESSRVVSIDRNTDQIEAGTIRGSSLFHSFEAFNVAEGWATYFYNPSGIENIFSRVTGSSRSEILGRLGVLGAADLFLLNPNGILFGPDAQLDISGSFVGTTATDFDFGNGLSFSALGPNPAPLLNLSVTPGLQFGTQANGAITNRGNLAVGQDLRLEAHVLDLHGQLQSGTDLTLRAVDALKVRDTVAEPFLATAGGKLLVQGDRSVDILALNHPESGLYSGGEMVLRSDNPVGGGAHYWSGQHFRVEQLDTSLGNLVSPQDPVIFSGGNVLLEDYEGASLHILAGGAVKIGQVTINSAAPRSESVNPIEVPPLSQIQISNGSAITLDASTQPTLDIRSGVDPNIIPNVQETLPDLTNTDIKIDKIIIEPENGFIFLSNQYMTNSDLLGGSIIINPEGKASSSSLNAQTIILDAQRNINVANSLVQSSSSSNPGKVIFNAGNLVQLDAQQGMPTGILVTLEDNVIAEPTSIEVNASSLEILNGAQIESRVLGSQNSGDIHLNITEKIWLDGSSPFSRESRFSNFIGTNSMVFSSVLEQATGKGGDINISSETLEISNGAFIESITASSGEAGQVEVNTSGDISIDGFSLSTGFGSGIYSDIFPGGTGNAGDVSISSKNLTVTNGGYINSANVFGSGDTGDLLIEVDEDVRFSGISNASGFGSSAVTSIETNSRGNAGDVSISAQNLLITDGGLVGSVIFGNGDSGNVRLKVSESIIVDGPNPAVKSSENLSVDSGGSVFSGIFSAVEPSGLGNSGELAIAARNINISNGALISTGARGKYGSAGNIIFDIEDTAIFNGFANQSTSAFIGDSVLVSGVFSSIAPDTQGSSGNIDISADELQVINGARLSSSVFGFGDAGRITLDIAGTALLDGGELPNNIVPGGIATSIESSGNGSGGDIDFRANDIQINRKAALVARNLGIGTAGNIILRGEFLSLKNEGMIIANSISGNGGNIFIGFDSSEQSSPIAQAIVLQGRSFISTAAGDEKNPGNGGDIKISTPFLIGFLGENSDVIANAFSGDGGKITINAQGIFNFDIADDQNQTQLRQNTTNDISASSEKGTSGTITLNTPDVDPSRGLTELPSNLVDPANAIARTCTAPVADGVSSFVLSGRGGLPVRPGGAIAAGYPTGDIRSLSTAIENTTETLKIYHPLSAQGDSSLMPIEASHWAISKSGRIELTSAKRVAPLDTHCNS